MSFSFKLALRYFRNGGTQTITMILLVAIGVLTYIFVSAAVNGLQGNTISTMLGSTSAITLEPYDREIPIFAGADGKKPLEIKRPTVPEQKRISGWQSYISTLEKAPGVIVVSPLVSYGCVVIRGDISRSASIRGTDPDRGNGIVDLSANVIEGSSRLENSRILMGDVLASKVGVKLGERVRIQGGTDVTDSFIVAGLLHSNNFRMNETMVYMTLADAQRIGNMKGEITAIETKVTDIFRAKELSRRLSDRTGLKATPWMDENGELLNILNTSGIIFGLVRVFALAAVSFGIAAVLSVAVNQRSKEIGILKSMGATTGSMIRVFLLLGLIVGVVGGLCGSMGSIGLFKALGSLKPPSGKQEGPVTLKFDFQLEYIYQGVGIATFVSVLGAILPSRKAAKLDPVEAIRNG